MNNTTEIGFWSPTRGYWQTLDNPSAATRATYPSDTIEVGLIPGPDHIYDGTQWLHAPVVLTPAEVLAIQLDTPLKPWQFRAALKLNNLDGPIAQKMNQIATPKDRAIAVAKLESSDAYHRYDTLFTGSIPAALGLTPAMIDALWVEALNLS